MTSAAAPSDVEGHPGFTDERIDFFVKMSDVVLVGCFVLPLLSLLVSYVTSLLGGGDDDSSSGGGVEGPPLEKAEWKQRDEEEEAAMKAGGQHRLTV